MRKCILLLELFATAYLTSVTEIDGQYIQKLLLLSWLETKKWKGKKAAFSLTRRQWLKLNKKFADDTGVTCANNNKK